MQMHLSRIMAQEDLSKHEPWDYIELIPSSPSIVYMVGCTALLRRTVLVKLSHLGRLCNLIRHATAHYSILCEVA